MIKLRCLSVLVLMLSATACDDPGAAPSPVDATASDTGPALDRTPASSPDAASDALGADGLAVECMPAVHPGTVTFVDEDTGVTTVDDAAGVPDSIKWHETETGRVPVIKVVKHTISGGQIELLLYGPCGLVQVVIAMT